jgi:hypothetical protein
LKATNLDVLTEPVKGIVSGIVSVDFPRCVDDVPEIP